MNVKYKFLLLSVMQFFLLNNAVYAYTTNPINHIFIRLDVDTLAEISKNEFLQNEFSDFYAGTVGDLNNEWTAVYIQGKNTYLELFDNNGSTTKADVGIAFGVDSKSHYLNSLIQISNICIQPMLCEIEHRVKEAGGTVWFSQFKVIDENDKLDTWIMSYDPDYVSKKPTPKGSVWAASDSSSREKYNSEWYKPERLLKDIEEVHLTVTPEHFNRIVKTMLNPMLFMGPKSYAATLDKNGKEVGAVISQNGTKYFHLKFGDVTKVDKIVMSLNRDVSSKVYLLGKSKIELQDTLAVWSFN